MKLTSKAFANGQEIPSLYTCEGKNISPPLSIADVPSQAKTLALIVEDPDVPSFVCKDQMWNHWVVYNIPPDTQEFQEAAPPPGQEGKNTSGDLRYEGPCPPDREHRYFFKLYALDTTLHLAKGPTKKEVEKAMQGHILKTTVLIGRYNKKRK